MIQLQPISAEMFASYRLQATEAYRPLAERVSQRIPADLPAPGEQAFEQRLPQGSETPTQRLYEIHLEAGRPVGVVWVDVQFAPNLAILRDVWMDPPYRRRGYATQALQAAGVLLRDAGFKEIEAAVYGELPEALGLLEKAGYHLTNLYMLRELNQPLPPQTRPAPPVRLEPIEEDTFQDYLAHTIQDYANEKIAAGNWKAREALERSRKEFNELLPNGRQTPNQNLYSILTAEPAGVKTGVVWWGPLWDGKLAYIWDFVVYEAFRGQGYAKAGLFALEDMIRAAGLNLILLHVFAHNTTARALYERAGYWNCHYFLSRKLE